VASKRKSQRKHARMRARERYGIEVGEFTRNEIIRKIQTGASTKAWRTSNRVVVHDVSLSDGTLVRVAYDSMRKEICSFLPYVEGQDAPLDSSADHAGGG
jgi:hypothetical protein